MLYKYAEAQQGCTHLKVESQSSPWTFSKLQDTTQSIKLLRIKGFAIQEKTKTFCQLGHGDHAYHPSTCKVKTGGLGV